MPEGTKERPPHTLPVGKPCLPRNHLDGMDGLFEHQPRRLETMILDGFRGGLTRLRAKGATELPWAQTSRLRELLDGQRGSEIALGVIKDRLDSDSSLVARLIAPVRRASRLFPCPSIQDYDGSATIDREAPDH